MSYPSKALSILHSLKNLSLDCISGIKLDDEFKNLSSLNELDFSQGIEASYIPDGMFQSFYGLQLEILNLTNLKIDRVSGAVFSRLASLRVLDLSNNPRLVSNVVDVAHGLRNTSIEELYMINTYLGFNDAVEAVLDKLNGTNIKVLALDRNEIHEVKKLFIRLPQIEILTLANNAIQNIIEFFQDIFVARSLKRLDLNYQKLLLHSSYKRNMNKIKSKIYC